ncbi:MAG: CPBP family intramembrane metalloprotease [Oscillospiraceae bacterium]|nr:CPBP family intramembrane metalloprotease [Oscillospiraceae bacterium]
MKKLFDRNEVTFAVALILVYVIGSSIMQSISEALGTQYLAEAVFNVILTAVLFAFVRRSGLMRHVGLCRSDVPAAKMLFYIPLFLIGAMCAFFGLALQYSPVVVAFHTVAMLCAGFLEEVIFRGFLFKGIAKGNLKSAVIISSLTFGVGHIVNLFFNDYELFDSLTQITYAVIVGFMLVFIFLRTGSTLPCIAFHAFNNVMTAFASGDRLVSLTGSEQTAELICLSIMIAIALVYTIYIVKALPKREITE